MSASCLDTARISESRHPYELPDADCYLYNSDCSALAESAHGSSRIVLAESARASQRVRTSQSLNPHAADAESGHCSAEGAHCHFTT